MSKKKSIEDRDYVLPQFKNNINSWIFPISSEENTMPSMTVPNMAMTPRELLIRFASGLPLDAAKEPIYEGEDPLPDIDKMDNIERQAYYQELKSQRDEVEARVKQSRVKAEQMKMDKIVEERIIKRKAEQEQNEFNQWKKQKGGQS